MSHRTPLVAGNWKMHMTSHEAREFAAEFCALLEAGEPPRAEIAICPPFTALETVAQGFATRQVWIAAQDVHEEASGAHTGEVSAAMIAAAGAEGAIIGHSERREAGETDARVAAKVHRALTSGLRAILCVGESLDQRGAGETESWLTGQVNAALSGIAARDAEAISIAYEPIWAIGTGRTATPEIAQDACRHLRRVAGGFVDADALRVLYGGSVNPENAAELMAQDDIDGALVGGASLDPESLMAIVRAA
ncbi:MAG: triose-phosphate isomerase [Thermoleophilia bacterium]|nr:triose-phosphate isomerase [Thermoleophilia bacterium]